MKSNNINFPRDLHSVQDRYFRILKIVDNWKNNRLNIRLAMNKVEETTTW
jgi:hypothetical protein